MKKLSNRETEQSLNMKTLSSQKSDMKVDKLRKALQQLEIARQAIAEVLDDEIAKSDESSEEQPSNPPLWTGYPHKIGDKVRIKNPSFGQSCEGKIIGRTGKGYKGFIQVQPKNKGKIINRIPSNLIILY